MSAIADARSDLVALFRYGDDEQRPIMDRLKAAYAYEPKVGDPASPYLSIWQDGATDDDQFFRFQVRLYLEMATSARDGQFVFDGLCLEVDAILRDDPTFIVTGWQTEWNGNLLVAMFDVLYGRTDVV